MIVKSSIMYLNEGAKKEYIKRHNELWPELKKILNDSGVVEYYIFLNEDTNNLITFIKLEDNNKWDEISSTNVCKKWWKFMKDIMSTNNDNSPISNDNEIVFKMIDGEVIKC